MVILVWIGLSSLARQRSVASNLVFKASIVFSASECQGIKIFSGFGLGIT